MKDQNYANRLEQENRQLKEELKRVQIAYKKVTENQIRLGEITNNYLMMHYLIKNVGSCRTSDQLWETYLHNITDRGFDYHDAYVLIADDLGNLKDQVSLRKGKLVKSKRDFKDPKFIQQDLIEQVSTKLTSATSVDNLSAAVPLVDNCGNLEALLVVHKQTGIFYEDLEMLDVYTQQTVATIENILLNEKLLRFQDLLGKRLDQFVLLHYVTKQIHEASNYDEVLDQYMNIMTSPMGFNFQAMAFYLIEGQSRVKKITRHNQSRVIEFLDELAEPLLHQAWVSGEQQLSEDQTRLIYPMNPDKNPCILIEIDHHEPIGSDQMQMIEIFALQTASVLYNLRLREELQYLSYHDSLTGLYSRAFFHQKKQEFISGNVAPVCVMLCDIDRLKQVNDSLGHEAGDRMIQAMARILTESLPSEAFIARIGGDEFVVLVEEGDLGKVKRWYQAIQEAIQCFNGKNGEFTLGLSVGYAVSQEPNSIDELFRLADARMYKDKAKRKSSVL